MPEESSIVADRYWTKRLLEAFGENPDLVKTLAVKCETKDHITITVERYLLKEECQYLVLVEELLRAENPHE